MQDKHAGVFINAEIKKRFYSHNFKVNFFVWKVSVTSNGYELNMTYTVIANALSMLVSC